MFWDKVAGLYDLFEIVYNGKVYQGIGERVSEEIDQKDIVLDEAWQAYARSNGKAAERTDKTINRNLKVNPSNFPHF